MQVTRHVLPANVGNVALLEGAMCTSSFQSISRTSSYASPSKFVLVCTIYKIYQLKQFLPLSLYF